MALYGLKKLPFPQNKRFSFTESFTLCPQKPLVFATKTPLFEQLFTVLKSRLFTCKKPFIRTKTSFARAFLCCPQKIPIFTNQKLFFCRKLYEPSSKAAFFTYKKPFIRTNLSLLLSKATLFHPPPPLSTSLNLLFAKNTAVLLISALTPYAVKPERRTDSNHCRRYPENCCFLRCRLPDECRSLSLQKRIDRRFESFPGVQRFANLWCTFGSFRTSEKHEKRPFAGSFEVLQTSNQHTAAAASHRNN